MSQPFIYQPPTAEQERAMRGMTIAEKIKFLPVTITRIEDNIDDLPIVRERADAIPRP